MATGVELGTAFLSLVAETSGMAKSVRQGFLPAQREADRAGRTMGKKVSGGIGGAIKSGAGRLVAPIGAALAGVGVAKFFSDSVANASDLQEAGTKIGAIFGKGSTVVQSFAKDASKQFGQSRNAALDAAGTFGVFGKSAGLSGKDLAKFSTDFVGLSADLASFNNTTPEQAVEAIGAALRGESEPMRQYGVLLDDATLKNRAMKLGLIDTTKKALTPQQKVLAAQAEIYAQTKDAQGDFAKTSGGLANQQRILKAQFEDVKTQVGEFLLPVMNKLGLIFTEKVMPAIRDFIQGWKDGSGAGGTFRDVLERVWGSLKSVGSFLVQHKGVVLGLVGAWATWRAGLLAYKGAMAAVTAGTKIWTGVTKAAAVAQRILNVAMKVNPIGLIITGIGLLVGALVWFFTKTKLGKKIIATAWSGIKSAIKGVADWWTKTAWPNIKKAIDLMKLGFKIAKEKISNALTGIKNAVKSVASWITTRWNTMVVFFKGIPTRIKTAFGNGWSFLKDKAKAVIGSYSQGGGGVKGILWGVINFIKNTLPDKIRNAAKNIWGGLVGNAGHVINSVIGFLNKIPGVNISKLTDSDGKAYATGGVLPGYTPGRDVHEFYSPTGGRLSLSGGEAIMRPEFTRAVGGAAGVARLNAMARKGQAFKNGGIWTMEKFKTPEGLPGPVAWLVKNTLGRLTVPSLLNSIVKNVLEHFGIGSAADGGKAVKTGAGGRAGMGVSAMTKTLRALIPGAHVTSGYRPGAMTVTGVPSYHGLARAIDIVSGSSGLSLGQIWDRLVASFGKIAPEIFFSGRSFMRFGKRGAPRNDHWDHVHWAMKNGGVLPKLYDQGGWLPQGLSVVENRTSKPERILNEDQWQKVAGGRERVVENHFHGITDAKPIVREIRREERNRAIRMGMANMTGEC